MDWSQHLKVKCAADLLRRGSVIAYPTEAVWGLGCSPEDDSAVHQLLALKRRPVDKGLILVAAASSQFETYLRPLSPQQRQILEASWPGPNTWIVPDVERQAPEWIRGKYDSIALRVSDHPLVAGLCRAFGGPIVSTSANPQGMSPALHQWQVRRYFGQSLGMITPGAVGRQQRPTQIRDLLTGAVVRV